MSEKKEALDPCRVCSTPTPNKCSLCKIVSYCSKDHQKEDWKQHKDICRPFELKSTPELGRYLEASRKVSCGDVLFTEAPIVFGPRPEDLTCLGCYSLDPQERCPQCFWPACSSTCSGLSDPDHHASECVVLRLYTRRVQFLAADFFKYEAILPLRCLLLQRKNPKKWKTLLEMESHTKKRGPNTDVYKQTQDRVVNYLQENFFKALTKVEEESQTDAKLLPERSDETIHRICGILDVNALEVRLPNQSSINALYQTASLLEHNCLPNTRHVFECHPSKLFKLTVLANQEIQTGSHISTMYTHALWGTQQRQDHLRSTKYFTCRCRRCGDPTELGTFISALRCLAPGSDKRICGGSQLPVSPLDLSTEWRCDKCPTSLTSAQVTDLVNMIGNEVDHVQDSQPTVESLRSLLEKLRKLLHRNHYHCFAVMHSLVQLYGRQPGFLPEQMNDLLVGKKIKMCRELLTIITALDPTSSRLALYSSVIEHELASAILILAKRRLWKEEELTSHLSEAKAMLLRAQKSLAPEEDNSPGAKIKDVVKNALYELDAYSKFAGVSQ